MRLGQFWLKGNGTPGCIGEAQDRMDRHKAAGNERAMRRWRDIYRYLMTVAASDTGVETVILKAGEKYDYENDKVIKPRARPRRNGKDGR